VRGIGRARSAQFRRGDGRAGLVLAGSRPLRPSDDIGRMTVSFTAEELLAAMPAVGDTVEETITLGPCFDEDTCLTTASFRNPPSTPSPGASPACPTPPADPARFADTNDAQLWPGPRGAGASRSGYRLECRSRLATPAHVGGTYYARGKGWRFSSWEA
jgi:hypothetical protein